jgi:hypothetical protein
MALINAKYSTQTAANMVEQLFSDFESYAEARHAGRKCTAQVVVHEIFDATFVERYFARAEAIEGSSDLTPREEKKWRKAGFSSVPRQAIAPRGIFDTRAFFVISLGKVTDPSPIHSQ